MFLCLVRYFQQIILLMLRSYLHPTNNFGHHNNVHFYYWTSAIVQGKYWNNFTHLTTLEVRNNTFDEEIEIVNLHLEKGRTDGSPEIGKVLKPGVPFTFDLAPSVHDVTKIIRGVVTVRGRRSGKSYSMAFEANLLKNDFRAGIAATGSWEEAMGAMGSQSR